MALRGVAVLAVFLAVVFCNAGPTKSKDLATYVGVATGLSQVPKVKIIAEPAGSLHISSCGEDTCYTIPKGTNLTLICSLTYRGSKGSNNRKNKGNKEIHHIGRHNLGWAFPGAENQQHEALRYYHRGRGTTVENALQISNVHVNDTGNYVCYCQTKRGQWDGMNAFFINVEPSQPRVHVFAVPTFSVKPTTPDENHHYIVKAGSNVTLTCETSFTNKNVLISWVYPKAENEYEEKQIHSRHEGMNIKERILHIKIAQPEDSGNYTCQTRSLKQTTWGSPNTFYIQVGEENNVNKTGAIQKIQRHNMKIINIQKSTHNSLSSNATTTPASTTTSRTTKSTTLSSSTINKSTTLPTKTTTSSPTNSTHVPPPSPNKFDVGSFFGGMAVVIGMIILLKLIQVAMHKHRQRSYSYQNM
ncbi:unnamed protein product [Meganyctiphanes norvegica]|uniref:Ig-like domain-containing protein n=1 Tax=Meganyctiphanes norvegica TaxID=48144 RepID=A0AAV2RHN7_MEGNR